MVSLLDITPASVKAITVPVQGHDVEVRGLGLGDIAYLIQHFPEVKDLFAGKEVSFSFEMVLEKAPALVYAVIACGTGTRGSEPAMDTIQKLSLNDQAAMLEAIFDETFKGGVGPFVARVQRLAGVASDPGIKALGTNGRKPQSP